jgi:hypothetical protein
MGQFSYQCKECGASLKNNKDDVVLFHIVNGERVQKIEGTYDGYGRAGCEDWKEDWNEIVYQEFEMDESYGIAGYHSKCYHGQRPRTQSKHDNNQGW